MGPITTFTEWNFFQPVTGKTYHLDNFDISAVKGVSLNVDIQPVGGDTADPGNPINPLWEFKNYPLTVHGEDSRADNLCPKNFRLKRSDVDKTSILGYVLLDEDGNPKGGDKTIACLNNCGKYKFPAEPPSSCNPDTDGELCRNYQTFCAPTGKYYGTAFNKNAPPGINNCINNGVYDDSLCPVNGACWKNGGAGVPGTIDGTCQLRAFYAKNPKDCPDTVCTFPYGGYTNPYTGKFMMDLSTQPPVELCSDVDPSNTAAQCVGDDTIHHVLHRAYTWPNDPQTYVDDAPLYRIIYAPGEKNEPITRSDTIPECSKLPKLYGYEDIYGGPGSSIKPCDISVNREDAEFGIALPESSCTKPSDCPITMNCNTSIGKCVNWGCNLAPSGAGDNGVMCRWHPAPTENGKVLNCNPPTTDAYVTKSACGFNASGNTLVSSSITPAMGDPLFAEVVSTSTITGVNVPGRQRSQLDQRMRVVMVNC